MGEKSIAHGIIGGARVKDENEALEQELAFEIRTRILLRNIIGGEKAYDFCRRIIIVAGVACPLLTVVSRRARVGWLPTLL